MSLRNTIGSADLEATDLAFTQNAIAGLRADAEYFTHLLNMRTPLPEITSTGGIEQSFR